MDDQNQQNQSQNPGGSSNVLGSAPTMGDVPTPPSSPAGVTSDASGLPTSQAPADPMAAFTTPTASTEEKASGDPVLDALKRIEDKLSAIAAKVGA